MPRRQEGFIKECKLRPHIKTHKLPMIANEIVGHIKIQRLVNLSGYGDLTICVDHFENTRDIAEAAERMVWT